MKSYSNVGFFTFPAYININVQMNITGEFMITGHRGAASLAPENTLAGFKKALQSRVKWTELDTQFSADNIPIIFHDDERRDFRRFLTHHFLDQPN